MGDFKPWRGWVSLVCGLLVFTPLSQLVSALIWRWGAALSSANVLLLGSVGSPRYCPPPPRPFYQPELIPHSLTSFSAQPSSSGYSLAPRCLERPSSCSLPPEPRGQSRRQRLWAGSPFLAARASARNEAKPSSTLPDYAGGKTEAQNQD